MGHLVPWDNFVLEKKLPYLKSQIKELEKPNVREMNSNAALESRNMSKELGIQKFTETRLILVNEISKMPVSEFGKVLNIGASMLTVTEYFKGLIEHDLHHFQKMVIY